MKRIEKNIRFACLAALAIGLAACSQDELSPAGTAEGNAVQIGSVSIGSKVETRVSENPDDGGKSSLWDFDGTEQIAVQVKDGVQGVYTLNEDKSVTTTQPTYWTGSGTQTINAWYPVECGNIDLSNQSAGHLAYALFATATGTYPDAVALNFSHSLAKLRVRLKGDVELIEKIVARHFTSCSLNTTDGTVTGSNEGDITLTKANYGTETYWEANFAPGAVANDVLRFNDSFNAGIAYVTEFEAGKIYTATYTVMASDIVTFEGCTIADWQPGDDFVGGTAPADYIVEDGTYYVYSEVGLKAWADHVNAGNWSTNLTLMNDITMTTPASGSSNWTPIGRRGSSTGYDTYIGTIEGNGHTIDNMVVDDPNEYYATMVVALGVGGTIQNLSIGNGSHFMGSSYASSIAARNYDGKVINCHSAAKVEGILRAVTELDFNVAGIVSVNRCYTGNSYVIGCSFSGQLIADANQMYEYINIGGVVATNISSSGNGYEAHVVGCASSGSVLMKNANSFVAIRVGGVVGSSSTTGSDVANASACAMTGTVSFEKVTKTADDDTAIDAAIGRLYSSTATHVYWTPGSIDADWQQPYRTSSGTYDTLKEVDGVSMNWATAVDNMNAAIEEWNASNGNLCPNRFEQQNGEDQPPTLIKK